MAESENVSSSAPSTASRAVPSALAGTTPDPTTPFQPEIRRAGDLGPAERVTETGVPAADETDVEPSAHLPQIPGYNVLRTIGGGGMGTVFKAVHLGLNRVVALKLINAGWVADDEFRARFDREAKTLAALEHTNIVPVFDAGTWQGLPYLTMKFVAGKTLYHRLEVVRRDTRATARLMAQVARAVEYLHSRGIIHRDLKPLNILLSADGTPLVADFGLARPLADDSGMSMTLVPLGTRQYMSPEQSRGGRENYTPACDIWALGIILYELLAGHRPFGHDDPLELFRRIRFEPTSPIPADRHAPPELEAIARKCLEKDPQDRYQTAGAVAADLDHWLAGEPISVRPAPIAPAEAPVERPAANSVKKSRRSRVFQTVLAAALVSAVGAAVAGAGAFRDRFPREQQPAIEPPAPQVAKRTALERFAAGESIALTDEKGRPVNPVPPVAGHSVATRERGDRFEFSSTLPGVAALSEEPFPLPLKVTGSIAVTNGSEPDSLLAVYVARRRWNGGKVPHESFVLFGLKPVLDAKGPHGARAGLYWWKQNESDGWKRLDEKEVPRDPAAGRAGQQGVPVEIEVREEVVTGRVGGVELEPITDKMATKQLYLRLTERPGVGPYTFAPPIFGSGIGLFVRNADGGVSDLRVSKLKP